MKIGVQTAPILDRLGVDEGFRVIKAAGFDCVDMNIDHLYSGGDIVKGLPDTRLMLPDDELFEMCRPYKEAMEKYGVTGSQAHGPFPFYTLNDKGNEYVMHATIQCIKICEYLNIPYLVVHPSFCGYDQTLDSDAEWNINMDRYGQLVPYAKKHHVGIALENMFTAHRGKIYAAICSNMEEAVCYIDELNERAGEDIFSFCFDIGHALLCSLELTRAFETLGDRVKVLHVHDNNGINDEHLFPFMGICDWSRFVEGMRRIHYTGALSFETFNALNVIDPELIQEALTFLCATGRLFARRIEA